MRVLRLIGAVELLDFRRRDLNLHRFAAGRHHHVFDLRVLRDAPVLLFGGFRRDHDRVLQRAVDFLQRDVARQLVLELGRRCVAEGAGDVAGVKLIADKLAVGIQRGNLEDPFAHLSGRGIEMEPARLLEQKTLVDQRIENLLRQSHRLNHLGAERLPVHLLIIFLCVVEGAIVFTKWNRLAVDSRCEGAILLPNAASTAEPHVHVHEADHERRNYGKQSPLELLEVVAHQFEHRKALFESWMV